MILVDTSVWVNHLRRTEGGLVDMLNDGEAVTHAFVIGELACGGIRNRPEFLSLMSALPMLAKASDSEVLALIDQHRLMGQGLGLIDIHLLASCMLAGAALWTHDAKLAKAAARLELLSR